MINNYSIKNFKLHKDEYQFNLAGLTLLSGVNNSGKSSLIQSLRLLSKVNKSSISYTKLPCSEIEELISFNKTLNKDVNSDESIIYEFSLEMEEFEFCNIKLEFKSIINYDYAFIDMLDDGAVLDNIDIYYKNSKGTLNFLYKINMNGEVPITYDLFEIDLENNIKKLILEKVLTRGLSPQPIFKDNTVEYYNDLNKISMKLGQIGENNIKYIPAFRNHNTNDLAKQLELNKEKIIFDGKTKLIDSLSYWTNKILNSIFKIKVESNIPKIVAIDNGEEFDLKQIGFGNTQVLPIIVPILMAKKGDIILIENPEVHLHPKWKTNLIDLFYYAVSHGINIIIETQSVEIINRVRLKIKSNNILKDKTNLYFFEKHGFNSLIQNIEIEETGSLDIWPEDFLDKVTIEDTLGLL